MLQYVNSVAVFTLGTWDVHKYVAVLKRAFSRGAPTQQPPRMFPNAAVANFFFFYYCRCLIGRGRALKELKLYAKIIIFFVYRQVFAM